MNQNCKEIHVLARGVIIRDEKILLCKSTKHAKKFFYLPGGHVEHGEKAQQAVARELLEESGVAFEVSRFLGCLEYRFEAEKGGKCCHNHEYNFVFELDVQDDDELEQIISQEDYIELVWVALADLSSIDFRPVPLIDLF